MACNLTLSSELAERVGLKDKDGNTRKKITQAEFLSWLSKGNIEQLIEEGVLDAKKFQKLRDALYTKKEALKAAAAATGRTKNLKAVIRESIKGAVKYVTKTVGDFTKELYKAEQAGSKAGAKYQKQITAELQRAFSEYQKENPLPKIADRTKATRMKLAVERRAKRITNQKSLIKAIDYYNNLLRDAEYIERVDALRKAQKAVLRVNKDGLPATDLAFITQIRGIIPERVFNIDAFTEALNAYAANLGAKAPQTLDIRKRLQNLFAEQADLLTAQQEEIDKAKREFYDDMYQQAIATGVFEGTIDDYINWLESPIVENMVQPAEPSTDKKAEFVKEFKDFLNFLVDEMDLSSIIGEYDGTVEQKRQIREMYQSIVGASEETLMKVPTINLIKLQNILNNIVSEGDYTGFGDMIPQVIEQTERLKNLRGLNFRNIETKLLGDKNVKNLQVLLNSIIAGNSDAFIGQLFGRTFGKFAAAQKKLAFLMAEFDKELAKAKDSYKTAIHVDTIGFINQWQAGMTQEEAEAHVRERAERRASDYASVIENNTREGQTERQKALVNEAVVGLEYLQKIGAISDLNINRETGEVSFEPVETFVFDETIMNKDEARVYNFVRNFFENNTEDVMRNIAVYTARPAEKWINYYPTVTYQQYQTAETIESTSQIFPTVNMYPAVQKQFGATKQRKGLKHDRVYATGLRQVLRYGAYQNIVMRDMPYWKNYAYQSALKTAPVYQFLTQEKGLDSMDVDYVRSAVQNYIGAKFNHAAISKAFEQTGKKILNSVFQGFVRTIIQKPSQIIKQTASPAVYMLIRSPKFYMDAISVLQTRNGIIKDGLNRLYSESPEQLRQLLGQIELSEKQLAFEKSETVAGQKAALTSERVLDTLSKVSDFGITMLADSLTVKTAFLTGYIESLYKRGVVKNKQELAKHFEDIGNNVIEPDERSLIAGSNYQTKANNASDPDMAPEALRSKGGKTLYFLKYIGMTMQQSAIDSLRTTFDDRATPQEKSVAAREAFAYLAQAAVFRVVSLGITSLTVDIVAKYLLDMPEDEEEKEKRKNIKWYTATGMFIKDILFASRNLIYDVTASVFVNLLVAAKVKSLKEEYKEKNPNAKSTPYDGYQEGYNMFFGDPSLDNTSTGVIIGAMQGMYDIYEKYEKNADKFGDEGFNLTPEMAAAVKGVPFLLGNGTLNELSGWNMQGNIKPEDTKTANLSAKAGIPSKDARQAIIEYGKIGVNHQDNKYDENGNLRKLGYKNFVFIPPQKIVTDDNIDSNIRVMLSNEFRLILNGQQAQAWLEIRNYMKNRIESAKAQQDVGSEVDKATKDLGFSVSSKLREKIIKDAIGVRESYYNQLANQIIYYLSNGQLKESQLGSAFGVDDAKAKQLYNKYRSLAPIKQIQTIQE